MAKAERAALAAASGALALGVALQLALARAPQAADFILPRRPGFLLFQGLIAARSSPVLGPMLSWTGLLLALGGLLLLLRPLGLLKGLGWRRKAAGAAAALSLLAGARWSAALFLDLLRGVWGDPSGVGPAQPILAFLWVAGVSAALGAALGSAVRLIAGRAGPAGGRGSLKARCAGAAALMLLPAVGLDLYAALRLDWRAASMAEAAGIPDSPRRRRLVVILQETDRPRYEVHHVGLGIVGQADYSRESMARLEDYVGRGRRLYTREALRHLYGGYTRRMEAGRMRESLLEGHRRGDELARFLLLGNLAHAPVSPESVRMADELADEGRFRVGARGAALLALAYGHLGDEESASFWRQRASRGALGIPPGLFPSGDPAARPAALRGRVAAPGDVLVGLYARTSPGAPYGLTPSELVASTRTGPGGRFEFKGIAPGDYYLALALDDSDAEVSISGHGGDIRLSGKDVTLPPLRLSLL